MAWASRVRVPGRSQDRVSPVHAQPTAAERTSAAQEPEPRRQLELRGGIPQGTQVAGVKPCTHTV